VNTADPKQVGARARRAKDAARRRHDDTKAVLSTPAGRRLIWYLLERAGVFESVMGPDGVIQYQAGRQDFGHEIMALVEASDPEAIFALMREARDERIKEQRTQQAEQTPAVKDEGEE
jgi:hypothetical protein